MAPTHHRRSIRLREYDYSWAGWYYVTLCSHKRECVFGNVKDDLVELTREGKILEKEWLRTPGVRQGVELDEFVVMPNHLHGILIIGDTRRGVLQYAPTREIKTKTGLHSPSQTLGAILRGFKSTTAKQINLLHGTPRIPVWQRNYYEHVIRNDADLHRIRTYIQNNPLQWAIDEENPANI